MLHRICLLGNLRPIACWCVSIMISFAAISHAETSLGAGAGALISTYSKKVHYSTSSEIFAPFGPVGALYVRTDIGSNFCLRADFNYAYLIKSLFGASSNSSYESIEVKPCFNSILAKGSRVTCYAGIGPNVGGFYDKTSWADDFTVLLQQGAQTSGYDRAAGMIAGICTYAMFQFKRIEIGPVVSVNGNFVLWKDREVIVEKANAVYDPASYNPASGVTLQAQISAGFPVGAYERYSHNKQKP